ncbi:group 1 truncated hemoglobin [uncultured Rubinisphaera sp.]|uniref:group I truncated hemoglobin n=1 Tax=uncultured Rubinisphaera sp. TaxID=1678686 RepID=UPI000ED1374F|nr:group 1 truncated hemoglobin [Planctomycetaceae bacterium]|tara:strand:+ start:684 stop:1067 length:384 start_codon:yes stop_codon:yes gene_type:complete
MNSEEEALYYRLGGSGEIRQIIDDMYNRVLEDPLLKGFFENVDMTKQRQMQTEFIAAALGGPEKYGGLDLAYAHAGRGITSLHLSAFVGHLLAVLEERGVSDNDIHGVVTRINTYANDITGATSSDG